MLKPKARPAGQWEARALGLNGRGAPHALGELLFPPGEWVPVTAGQAQQLGWLPWAEVREKEAG